MRNPLAHLVHRNPDKPTLRERAAALKASAGRVMRKKLKAHVPGPGDWVASEANRRQPAPHLLEPMMVRWRKAAKVASADLDDDEGTRLADIMTAAEHEIIRAKVTSVRDLACKIELLGTYRGVHDLDHGLPKFLLDAICKDIAALVRADAAKERTVASQGEIVEDAELLALGREFDAIHAKWTLAAHAGRRAEKQAAALSAELRGRRGWTWEEAHEVAWAQPGVSEQVNAQEALAARMEKVGNWIRAAPVRTIDGLAVKARVAIPAVWASGHYEDGVGLGEDKDWVELNARSPINACLSLAGVDWTGRRIRDAARVPEGASTITPNASASEIDLSGLGINDLCAFYETLKAARALWNGAMCEPRAEAKVYPSGCVDLTPFGERADFEDSRIGSLMDRVANEAVSRRPTGTDERNDLLALRIQHEIACEGRIRDRALLSDIAQAWG